MANLRLDGILPHDVTTRDDYELTEALVRSTDLPYLVLTDNERLGLCGHGLSDVSKPSGARTAGQGKVPAWARSANGTARDRHDLPGKERESGCSSDPIQRGSTYG